LKDRDRRRLARLSLNLKVVSVELVNP